MRDVFLFVGEIVASNSVAVTVAVLVTATLVFLCISGLAGRFTVLLEDRLHE